jgi:hypothetical protein
MPAALIAQVDWDTNPDMRRLVELVESGSGLGNLVERL